MFVFMDYIALNIPHSSAAMARVIPYDDSRQLATDVHRWTDWHTDVLFKPQPELSPKVIPYVFPYSRFYVDIERLENDPLESIGEGIVYTNFYGTNSNGNGRQVTAPERAKLMALRRKFLSSILLNERTLLLDCHSFPSDLATDIDICIGYNDDNSRPSDKLLQSIADTFAQEGYRVAFNKPYSNAITPRWPIDYLSVMIEVNKAVYMDERTLRLTSAAGTLTHTINKLYKNIIHG